MAEKTPPEILFHGTAEASLPSIRNQGLLKRRRQHVHLSSDESTALQVGSRHGKPVILKVRTGEMARAGIPFYLSENEVWLVKTVPPEYLVFPEP